MCCTVLYSCQGGFSNRWKKRIVQYSTVYGPIKRVGQVAQINDTKFCIHLSFLSKMCPHQTNVSDAPMNGTEEMVAIQGSSNGHNGTSNGLNGGGAHRNGHSSTLTSQRNPYAPRASDFLNNVSNFKIIESTLRGPSLPSLFCLFLFLTLTITHNNNRGRAICQCFF